MSEPTPNPNAGYEMTDAHMGPVVKFLFWLTVATLLVMVAMYGMLRGLQEIPPIGDREPHPLAAQNDPIPPAPHLEEQLGVKQGWDGKNVDLSQRRAFTQSMARDLKSAGQKHLGSYGWIDQKAGVVHVPIERAMEIALQKGFPVTQKPKD